MATNAPGTRADDESTEPRGWQLLHSYLQRTMSGHVREFGFLAAVLFTLYAAFQSRLPQRDLDSLAERLQSCHLPLCAESATIGVWDMKSKDRCKESPLRTRKAPLPMPFFSKHSLVVDHFTGSVMKAFERMPDSDFTFVMYYAPWDAASMVVREDFEKIARYHHDQVYFAAINCWWPEGECRKRFSKIHSFPVLIAYRRSGKGIQFRGKPTFPRLVRFLDDLIDPITAVHSRKDLMRLLVKHNVMVVGYFGFHISPQPPGYSSFYIAALKALEKDPDRTVGFAVISNARDASKFGMKSNSTIHLYLWNSTLSFVHDGPLTSKAILDWVFRKKHEVVQWLSPPGTKSALLSGVLENSATIVMFTPKFVESSLSASPYYYMFKEVALDYFKCNGSSQMDGVIAAVRREFVEAAVNDRTGLESCANVEDVDGEFTTLEQCCQSVVIENVRKEAIYNKSVCEMLKRHFRRTGCAGVTFHFEHFSVCCGLGPTTQLSSAQDHSSESASARYRCMLLHDRHVASALHVPSVRLSGRKLKGFTSLGCRTNRTLSFVVMDSLEYHVFFDRLGIDVLAMLSKTAVAIIQAEQESHYVLNEQVTSESLRKFIMKYSRGQLRSHSRSVKTKPLVPKPSENHTAVQEITGENFGKVVMDDNKDIMLLVYAPWCTFCSGIAHVYLSAARYLQSLTKTVHFVRINGDANDLPWEFNVQRYPTLMFFPAGRKADSVEFPVDIPVTTTSIIHFVLLHTNQEIRLLAALGICSSSCITQNRRLALQRIGDLLRNFRKSDGQLREVRNILNEECQNGGPVDRQLTSNYVEYARYLTRQMCELRVQLCRAKLVHLMLSTVPGDQLTMGQLQTILNLHQEVRHDGCEDFLNSLYVEFGACPGLLEPSHENR